MSCYADFECVAVGGRDRTYSTARVAPRIVRITGPTLSDDDPGEILGTTEFALEQVSCASSTFCLAVSTDVGGVVYRNGTWQGWNQYNPVRVDCAAADRCAALVEDANDALQLGVYDSSSAALFTTAVTLPWDASRPWLMPDASPTAMTCTPAVQCALVGSYRPVGSGTEAVGVVVPTSQ